MSLPPSYNLLKQYPNPVYIETGIWRGDSIALALEAGFNKVIGIDCDIECVRFCAQRFNLNKQKPFSDKIKLFTGSSLDLLYVILDPIDEPITFFLDAHAQFLEGEPEYQDPYPLLQELEEIGRHRVRSHTIIIDDILHLTHPRVTGWDRGVIEAALLKINPAYQFQYLANPVKENLLVATV